MVRSTLYPTAAACTAIAAGVFVTDLVTPRGVSESVLYTVAVLTALRAPGARLVLGVAAVCSVLTVLGFVFSPGTWEAWKSAANRGFTLVAIWTTAVVGYQRQALLLERQKLLAEREELLTKALSQFIRVCAWCKKVQDDGREWRSLEGYVREHTAATFTHGMCPTCLRQHAPEPSPAAAGAGPGDATPYPDPGPSPPAPAP